MLNTIDTEDGAAVSSVETTAAKVFVKPTESNLVQLFRFGLTGVLAMTVDYAVLLSLAMVGVNQYISVAAGNSVGLLVCYVLSIRWIFAHRSISDRRVEFVIFVIIGVVGTILTEIIIHFVLAALKADPKISAQYHHAALLSAAKFVAVVIVFFFNFVARKTLLFARPRG